jgi:esterase/lipase superfamily enzyme
VDILVILSDHPQPGNSRSFVPAGNAKWFLRVASRFSFQQILFIERRNIVQREYHRWWSKDLQRDMSLLVFGWGGRKILVFPTSRGRFFEYEDNKMIAAVADKLDSGELQIYCVDSVDDESWYNTGAHPYWRLQRHLQYERYIINDVFPLMWNKNWTPYTAVTGCSFGAYHAVNLAFRHPELVNACICMGGSFDIRGFMDGWSSEDVYFNNPPEYLANCTDGWKYNHIRTVLATGEHDMCWDRNERFAAILRARGIRHELYVWSDRSYHDWPWWRPMARTYL